MKYLLHDAIIRILQEARKPLTCSMIAEKINAKHLYQRGDKAPLKGGQIAARIDKCSKYFNKDKTQRPMLISLAN
jgi:hypothetical protein